jgi:hypothetical protein
LIKPSSTAGKVAVPSGSSAVKTVPGTTTLEKATRPEASTAQKKAGHWTSTEGEAAPVDQQLQLSLTCLNKELARAESK